MEVKLFNLESGKEVDAEGLPSVLMQFAEYYLAVKLQDNLDLNVIILDRTLASDVGHLIWSVNELVREGRCMLQGLQTEFGVVFAFDLELARILHPKLYRHQEASSLNTVRIDFLLLSMKGFSQARL